MSQPINMTNVEALEGRVEALINNRPVVTWGPTAAKPTGQLDQAEKNALYVAGGLDARLTALESRLSALESAVQAGGGTSGTPARVDVSGTLSLAPHTGD